MAKLTMVLPVLSLDSTMLDYSFTWGRPGFDVGIKAVQGIPRISYLVNTTETSIVANDETYALAA